MSERGQAVPLLLFVLVIFMCVFFVVKEAGRGAIEDSLAQAAADASALAGVQGGERAAREIAALNRANLKKYTQEGDEVQVVVTFGDQDATARAAPGNPSFATQ